MVEAEKFAPCLRVLQGHRRVDYDPGHGRAEQGVEKLRPAAVARRQDQECAQEKERPQLKGSAKADEDTRYGRALARGGQERTYGKGNGGDIPVAEGVNNDKRAGGDEDGVPSAIAHQQVDHVEHAYPDARHDQGGQAEVPSGLRDSGPLNQRVRIAGDPSHQPLE